MPESEDFESVAEFLKEEARQYYLHFQMPLIQPPKWEPHVVLGSDPIEFVYFTERPQPKECMVFRTAKHRVTKHVS